VCPAGHTDLEVKVLCRPEKGNCQPNGKGCGRDEQKPYRRHTVGVRRPNSSKPNTCTEGLYVNAAGISGKVGVSYPGRSHVVLHAPGVVRRREAA